MLPTVHPFPARMAPELAEDRLRHLTEGLVLLDPMMGSGSFVLSAAEQGHHAIGFDSDPLSYVITTAAAGVYDHDQVRARAKEIVTRAPRHIDINKVTQDEETLDFINFWFDPVSRDKLSALAIQIAVSGEEIRAPLWCAFSRLIITKDNGASKARDASHSRPHRVREYSTVDPIESFIKSVDIVLKRARKGLTGKINVGIADARALTLPNSSIDGIMTSPPYLIAIDYLRGHRLSLVWMGFTISELRALRSTNVGAERMDSLPEKLGIVFQEAVEGDISHRKRGILSRYIKDLDLLIEEQNRVLRQNGFLTYVIANARHGNSAISVESIVNDIAISKGFEMTERSTREIPQNRRYLPPPNSTGNRPLDRRMHTEVILSYRKP